MRRCEFIRKFQDLDASEKSRVLDALVHTVREAGQVAHAHYEGRHSGFDCQGLRFASDGCPKFFRLTSQQSNIRSFIEGQPYVFTWDRVTLARKRAAERDKGLTIQEFTGEPGRMVQTGSWKSVDGRLVAN